MNTKKNLHRWKIEYFIEEVLSNPEIKDALDNKRLFSVLLLTDLYYVYSQKQFDALIERIVY